MKNPSQNLRTFATTATSIVLNCYFMKFLCGWIIDSEWGKEKSKFDRNGGAFNHQVGISFEKSF